MNPKEKKERLQWEGFAEKEGFKPEMKDWVGDGIPNNSKLTVGRQRPYKILQLNALHKCHQHL